MISLDMIGDGGTFNMRYMEKGPRALVNTLPVLLVAHR